MAVLKRNLTRQAGAAMSESALIMILVSLMSIVSLKQIGNYFPRTTCAVMHMGADALGEYWDPETGTCWYSPESQCEPGVACEQSNNQQFYFSRTFNSESEFGDPVPGGPVQGLESTSE